MTIVRPGRREALASQVRTELEAQGGYPSLQQMAGKLCVSARTLKRHLRGAGASYREVLDSVRMRRAAELLRLPGLSMEAIAERLGYSSSANFSRAFRRWAGITPGLYRGQGAPRGEGERLS